MTRYFWELRWTLFSTRFIMAIGITESSGWC